MCKSDVFQLSSHISYFCVQDVISADFIHRLKALLHRAYRLQEEFEGVLGVSEPSSHSSSQGESLKHFLMPHTGKKKRRSSLEKRTHTWWMQICRCVRGLFTCFYICVMMVPPFSDKVGDIFCREDLDDTCLRDSISIASTDSFVSAAEVREALIFTWKYFH